MLITREPPLDEASLSKSLIGTWRRFGAVGPVYEIVGFENGTPNGDRHMRIRVIESGEELNYPIRDILDDPRER